MILQDFYRCQYIFSNFFIERDFSVGHHFSSVSFAAFFITKSGNSFGGQPGCQDVAEKAG